MLLYQIEGYCRSDIAETQLVNDTTTQVYIFFGKKTLSQINSDLGQIHVIG